MYENPILYADGAAKQEDLDRIEQKKEDDEDDEDDLDDEEE